MKYIIAFFFFCCFYFTSNAQIKGTVTDSSTNEPIIGATIFIASTNQYAVSGLDGSFNLKNIPEGKYLLSCRFLGYNTQTKKILLEDRLVTVHFFLSEQVMKELVITGHINKETDVYARDQEKNARNIQNIISARTIQILPDITTAGVLQRMPGVSLERSSTGDARYSIIRGMDQRYNYTLVNGIKIPSPDNKFRYIPMDIFPAELLQRLEVIKSLTPSMEGDAIGGAVNLVMKDAPDRFMLTINAGSGLSQLLLNRGYQNFDRNTIHYKSPIDEHGQGYVATPNDFRYDNFDYKTKIPVNSLFGFAVGNRFLKGKRLGIILAGSVQNVYRGSNSLWFQPNNQPAPGNVPTFDDIFSRQYSTLQSRYGLQAKIDYDLGSRSKIALYSVYVKMNEQQYRHTIDTSLSIGRSGTGTGNTYILWRSRTQLQSIYNNTLQGTHELFKGFFIKWSAVYSLASNKLPDWSEYQTVQVASIDNNGVQQVTHPVLNIPFYRIWTHNTDRDYAGYLDLKYNLDISGHKIEIATGGLYRDKARDNVFNEWRLIPKTTANGMPVDYDGHLTPDKFQFNGSSAAQGNIVNPLTYTAYEKILSYYLEANISITGKLEVLGGLRIENTNQGWKTVQDPTIVYGVEGYVPYTDFLPSIHFRYKLDERQNVRLSYFSAINRPGFFEYVPFTVADDNFSLSGNPNLLHASSGNYDFRYEFFPKRLDELLLGAFYKKIDNPIEEGLVFNGTSSATLRPFNFGTATNCGFEAAFIHYWGRIGVLANYTYTHSSITTTKLYYDSNFVAKPTTQTRPLQGQAPGIGNLSLQYKNQEKGLDIQLSYVYSGKKITFVSPYKDLDYWQRAFSMIDLSAEVRLAKYFSAYCKINNILNTPVIVEILQPNNYSAGKFALSEQTRSDRITTQKDYYGTYYTFGIRFNNEASSHFKNNKASK